MFEEFGSAPFYSCNPFFKSLHFFFLGLLCLFTRSIWLIYASHLCPILRAPPLVLFLSCCTSLFSLPAPLYSFNSPPLRHVFIFNLFYFHGAPPTFDNHAPLSLYLSLGLFCYYAICTWMFTSLAPPMLCCIYLCLLIIPLLFMLCTPYVISPHLLTAPHFSQFTPLLLGSLYIHVLLTTPLTF